MEIEKAGSGITAKITLDVTQNAVTNQSTVTVSRVEVKSGLSPAIGSCWVTGSVKIDGNAGAELILDNTHACAVSLVNGAYAGGGTAWSGFRNHAVTVSHAADGTKKIKAAISLSVSTTSGVYIGAVSATVEAALPTIPRVSGISAAGVTLGNEMTVTLTRASAAFRDTVSWRCGGQSGTVATKTASTSLKWTPALSLASQAPSATSVTVTLTVTTYSGDTTIGSKSVSVSCPIPASVVPAATVTVSDKLGHTSTHGGYIQNQSQARVQTSASGAYGSTVKTVSVKCGSLSGTGTDVAFSLPSSGSVSITVTVTDSRGRTATVTKTITVIAYSKPTVTITDLYRCDANGTRQADGSYAAIVFNAKVASVTRQTAKYTCVRKVHNGTNHADTEWTDLANTLTLNARKKIDWANIGTAYDFTIRVEDAFQSVTSNVALLPVAYALMDFDKANRAVGIGMRAAAANTVSIGQTMSMAENPIKNLASPTDAGDAATKAYVDNAVTPYSWSSDAGNIYVRAFRIGKLCIVNVYFYTVYTAVSAPFVTLPGQFHPPGSVIRRAWLPSDAAGTYGSHNFTVRADGGVYVDAGIYRGGCDLIYAVN